MSGPSTKPAGPSRRLQGEKLKVGGRKKAEGKGEKEGVFWLGYPAVRMNIKKNWNISVKVA